MSKRHDRLAERIESSTEEMKSLMDHGGLIEPMDVQRFLDSNRDIISDAESLSRSLSFKIGLVPSDLKKRVPGFVTRSMGLMDECHEINDRLASRAAETVDAVIGEIEGFHLDLQQRSAIAKDVGTRLVIAGAGSGKTTTIVGLAKYLLKTGKAKPEDMLFLSFTNASVDSLRSRIQKETGERVDVSTFHRLGMKIIASAEGKVPRVYSGDVRAFVSSDITKRLSDARYMSALNEFVAFDCNDEDDEFGDTDDYQRFMEENPLVTIAGERVKSFGESDIANWLYIHGIPYAYEEPYREDTRTDEYGQYCPDFHISGSDVYIEYFGVDREGNVASFISSTHSGDASEDYRNGMEWKRVIHEKNGTKLIDLYAYQRSEGTLLETLEKRLLEEGIEIGERSPNAVYRRLTGGSTRMLDYIAGQFTTSITLIKGSGGWDRAYPEGRSFREKLTLRRLSRILKPIYDDYEAELSKNGSIDFEDMLNMASDIIESGAWKCPYRYVVVDEYQDLSRSRYRLLGSMRDSHWFSLFCVGDDWQSIYRFNGSDIGYILGFERYWGPSEICRIETTYRFSGTLLAASNRFMNSSGRQIHKVLRSGSAGETDLRIIRADNQSSCAAAISREMRDMPMGQTVIMLGRYRHDVVTLDGGEFKWSPEIGGNTFRVVCHSRPDLDIRFMTIHGSKGLEADAVFVLNNRKGPGGFPSMKPGVILERLLLESDEQPLDEERRLFYVAITRARKCAYLVTVNGMESRFIEEMSKSERRCPRCGGKLVLRKGPYGNFYGCSNYRKGCTYTQKP